MSVEVAPRDAVMGHESNEAHHGLTFQQYYDIIREQIRQEDQLIGTRMGWLTTSQTILFGFYANGARNALTPVAAVASPSPAMRVTSGPSMLPSPHAYPIIAVLGFVMTLVIYVSIMAAVRNLHTLRSHIVGIVTYADDVGRSHPVPNVTPSLKGIWYGGLVAPTVIPILFAAAWIVLAIFCFRYAS